MRRAALAGLVLAATACASIPRAASADEVVVRAQRAGLRVLKGRHVTLFTDRPDRPGDGIGELPRLFDEAFAGWCGHYGVDPERVATWHATGCLMVDRERFHTAGLLPTDGSVPDFTNGFCLADRFWMMDQSNPAYRRHLLFHEGVHAFTLTLLRASAPAWYTEGIAEYLAMHKLHVDASGTPRVVATPMPERPDDVEQLGRIERLNVLRRGQDMPGLAGIFALPSQGHSDLGAYASNWAAVAFLSGHPAYREAFRMVERQPLDGDLTTRLAATPGWDGERAGRDFDAFSADLDYGYDFPRMTIEWSPERPLVAGEPVEVAADRGWQHSGREMTRGTRCALRATGRVTVGQASAGPLQAPPDGITLRWYRGRPIGRLLVGQWVESPAGGGRPRFVVLIEGAAGTFIAATDGALYCKINESPGELADNTGCFLVAFDE